MLHNLDKGWYEIVDPRQAYPIGGKLIWNWSGVEIISAGQRPIHHSLAEAQQGAGAGSSSK